MAGNNGRTITQNHARAIGRLAADQGEPGQADEEEHRDEDRPEDGLRSLAAMKTNAVTEPGDSDRHSQATY